MRSALSNLASSGSRVWRRFWIRFATFMIFQPAAARPSGKMRCRFLVRNDQLQPTDGLLIDAGLCGVGVCGANCMNRNCLFLQPQVKPAFCSEANTALVRSKKTCSFTQHSACGKPSRRFPLPPCKRRPCRPLRRGRAQRLCASPERTCEGRTFHPRSRVARCR